MSQRKVYSQRYNFQYKGRIYLIKESACNSIHNIQKSLRKSS